MTNTIDRRIVYEFAQNINKVVHLDAHLTARAPILAKMIFIRSSPSGKYIGLVNGSRLSFLGLEDESFQSHALPAHFKNKWMRWHTIREHHASSHDQSSILESSSRCLERLLIADENTVRVFDAQDPQWKAVIKGAAGSSAHIANVTFGRDEDEVVVFSSFGLRMTIWSLVTSRGIELRDAKTVAKNHDYRPGSAHLALLTRPAAHDQLTLLDTSTYTVHNNMEIATSDAQALRWSPDGRWLAVQDAVSAGHKILIYTADGNLLKTLLRGQTAEVIGHGAKTMVWSPSAQLLAVGDADDLVVLYNSTTFSQRLTLFHSSEILLPRATVWEELIANGRTSREYAMATQPINHSANNSTSSHEELKSGISTIKFSRDSTLLATKSDTMPSTIWIWSLTSMIAYAVLLHHAPVKSVEWHPTIPDLLLVHCITEEPVVHIWKESWDAPKIVTTPKRIAGGKIEASWINTSEEKPATVLLVGSSEHTMVSLSHDGDVIDLPKDYHEPADVLGPDNRFDEGHSMDFSAVKLPEDTTAKYQPQDTLDLWDTSGAINDTFQFKHNRPATVTG